MNKILLLFLFLFVCHISKAQINALTDDGKQVILYQDGTWKYKSNNEKIKSRIDSTKTNSGIFTKSVNATFLVKSNIINMGVYIDTENWTVKAHSENETSPEYHFNLKSIDGYAMLIVDKTAVNFENMPNIILINAQRAAFDAKITNKEYRTVNGNKVLLVEMSATVQGIKLKYIGYYFSNEKGTTQLLCFTSESMYDEARPKFETFLNGLVVVN